MLGKLLKHEFYATFRIFLPIAAIVAVITPVSAGMLSLTLGGNEAAWAQLLTSLLILLYVLIMIGFLFSSTVIILFRFYKSMVSDEAYLTHTLPAKTSAIILSKLLVGVLLQIVMAILFTLSILFFTRMAGAWDMSNLNEFMNLIKEGMKEANINTFVFILEILLLSLVSIIYSILMMYASIAIGQLLKGHRILGSICAYIGISIIIQVVMSIITSIAMFANPSNVDSLDYGITQINYVLLGSTIIFAVFSAVFFFVTDYVFRQKLNLE